MHRATEPLLEEVAEVVRVGRAVGAPRLAVEPLELLLDVRPALVEDVGRPRLGGGDDVRPGQDEELAAAGEIADVDAVRPGGRLDVDEPVVHAAVDLDVADVPLGRAGRVLAGHVHQAEDRPGGVPLLPERGLRPRQGRTAQLPVGMEPVRVAGDRDDLVLDAGMIERPRGRHRDRPARGRRRPRDAVPARGHSDGLLRRRGLAGGLLRRYLRDRQGTDQLILTHRVPAHDPLVLGHLRQKLLVAVLERVDGHAGPLRLHPRRCAGRGSDKERVDLP